MIYNNKFSSVIKNSKDTYYRFYINPDKDLVSEEYTSTALINTAVVKKSICDYSLDIDENDVIHILYLSSDGTLRYSLYQQNQEDKTLATFDLRNNNINFLSLKLLLSEVHIFYMINNKHNIYQLTIYHNMWRESKWISEKISDITSLKYPYPFFIECDSKKNLYVFFSKNCTNIFSIKKYNSEFNIWTEFENSLTIDESSNASFFITDRDIAIISYNQAINKNNMTFIKYKDLTKLSSTWSNPIQISNTNSISSSIFTKNGFIYMIWEEGSNLVYRRTSDIQLAWSEKKVLVAKNNNIINSVYISNNSLDTNFKSSYIYMTISPYPVPLVSIKNINAYSSSNEPIINTPTKMSYSNGSINNNTNPIENIKTTISEKDKDMANSDKIISNLSEQLNVLSQEHYKKDLIIQKLNSELEVLNLKLNNDTNELNNINEQNHEKDLIIKKLKGKLDELTLKYSSDVEEYNKTLKNLNEQLDEKLLASKKSNDSKQNKLFKFFK